METPDPSAHSFIVKIWIEEAGKGQTRPTWRGHIVHVPGGERRYLKSLGDIIDFITPYLEEMNVALGLRVNVRRWLKESLKHFTSSGQKFS
jgi:hypothetical protein